VVRQVHYSPHRPAESIDVVLFVNGIPVATLELKTQSTQSVHDAIKQYRFDRPTIDPVKKQKEPLLQFKSRCIVHFAVSTEEVYMATRLDGAGTVFLPFNQGDGEGAGNPVNPLGVKTAYLQEKVLQRDNWLHILAKFVHLKKDEVIQPDGTKKEVESIIFPRYHQWDCVTKVVRDASATGTGQKYLIQHSAGSGKSNSIAWVAHHLATLHDKDSNKVFDSVIVITDRKVLDSQLQETIYQFEHKAGLVERITNASGAKSDQLSIALKERKPVIIVTIQTFGFVLQKLGSEEMAKYRFAVIADEAHTSQTGKSASSLKAVLGHTPTDDDEELSLEDLVAEASQSRYGKGNISYFAFTATPKPKTMQLFGRHDENGVYHAFHTYSMRQAIEEGFILDVLKGYISYKVAYKLAHDGKDYDDDTVDKSEASKALSRWVRLHPYNIAQKVQIVVEHFKEHVGWRLEGNAKAMVVTSSRLEAVRYKIAIDAYIKARGYKIGTIVAFSGEVNDKASSDHPLTETNMNSIGGKDIRDAFDKGDYQVLIVANKFQTGFDQPKLVAMYVDKQLSGVATVQTLSRLNRTAKGKDWTVVLDFVNDPQTVLADFQVYYKGCTLPVGTDPKLLLDLQVKLDALGVYTEGEVESFADAYFEAKGVKLTHSKLRALLGSTLQRFAHMVQGAKHSGETKQMDALQMFVKDIQSFCNLYDFLSQIIPFGDNELEKRYVYFKHIMHDLREILRTEIPKGEALDLSTIQLTHFAVKKKGEPELKLDPDGDSTLTAGDGAGTGNPRDKEQILLSQLVEQLNLIFEGELTDGDLINYTHGIRDKVMEDADVALEAKSNTLDRFANGKVKKAIPNAIIAHMEKNQDMTRQVMASEDTMKKFISVITDLVYKEFEKTGS
jgi:type I restriction enzyme R subunit